MPVKSVGVCHDHMFRGGSAGPGRRVGVAAALSRLSEYRYRRRTVHTVTDLKLGRGTSREDGLGRRRVTGTPMPRSPAVPVTAAGVTGQVVGHGSPAAAEMKVQHCVIRPSTSKSGDREPGLWQAPAAGVGRLPIAQ